MRIFYVQSLDDPFRCNCQEEVFQFASLGGGHDFIDRPVGTLLAFTLPPVLPAIVAVISLRIRRARYATGLFIVAAVVSVLETVCAMPMYK